MLSNNNEGRLGRHKDTKQGGQEGMFSLRHHEANGISQIKRMGMAVGAEGRVQKSENKVRMAQ